MIIKIFKNIKYFSYIIFILSINNIMILKYVFTDKILKYKEFFVKNFNKLKNNHISQKTNLIKINIKNSIFIFITHTN